jgi:IS1 family transposase
MIRRADEAELDEMWSFVGRKHEPRWLWHAVDHWSGRVLAYVFGRRQDEVFLQLKALLEPFGITRYHTDYWGAYTRHLAAAEHTDRGCPERRPRMVSRHSANRRESAACPTGVTEAVAMCALSWQLPGGWGYTVRKHRYLHPQ